MSESDSFIEEVSEEVRRDQLVRFFNKHRWSLVGVLVLIVVAVGASEYLNSAAQTKAEATGDAIIAAVEAETPETQIEALTPLTQSDEASAMATRLQLAAAQARADDKQAAAATLLAIAEDGTADPLYRETALLKLVMLQGNEMPMEERMQAIETLIATGGPLRPLAAEQRGLANIDSGNIDAALTEFTTLSQDIDASEQLRQRATQMIIALGGDPNPVADTEESVDQ